METCVLEAPAVARPYVRDALLFRTIGLHGRARAPHGFSSVRLVTIGRNEAADPPYSRYLLRTRRTLLRAPSPSRDYLASEVLNDLLASMRCKGYELVDPRDREKGRIVHVAMKINIQVFYQKDFQDLVFKYGLRMAAS